MLRHLITLGGSLGEIHFGHGNVLFRTPAVQKKNAKVVLTIYIALLRGHAVPLKGRIQIPRYSNAVGVEITQFRLGARMVQMSGFEQPLVGFAEIPGHALPLPVKHGDGVMGFDIVERIDCGGWPFSYGCPFLHRGLVIADGVGIEAGLVVDIDTA